MCNDASVMPKSWFGLSLVAGLGACSNIIGISEFEIDRSLDGGRASGGNAAGGNAAQGGKTPTAGSDNVPEGGDPSVGGSAGSNSGGSAAAGGTISVGGTVAVGGTTAIGGDGGMGGEPTPPGGCQKAADCDDTIDCTIDTCGANKQCVHTADSTACTPATGMCSSCKVGIGCVDSAPKTQELLLDPNFDQSTGDWSEYADNLENNIFTDPAAHTPNYSAKLGPAPAEADAQETANLFQEITIPAKAIKLTVSGFYKMLPGAGTPGRPISDDYTTLTLFSLEQPADDTHDDTWYIRYVDYHTWDGTGALQATWKAFSYETPKATLTKVLGQQVTLDLYTKTWDTIYYFDSLSLKASNCE